MRELRAARRRNRRTRRAERRAEVRWAAERQERELLETLRRLARGL